MENASKALMMAGGILIGILILTLMVTLFMSTKDFSEEYETTKKEESIQQFNTNFTKYLGRSLTIHEVVTISNFAEVNNVKVISGKKDASDIENIVESYTNNVIDITRYRLEVTEWSNGYVSEIKFSEI